MFLYHLKRQLRSRALSSQAFTNPWPLHVPFSPSGLSLTSRGWCSMKSSVRRKMVLAASAASLLQRCGRSAPRLASPMKASARSRPRSLPLIRNSASRMSVRGKVKIEVVITPDGHVRSTRVVGGHPAAGAGLPGRGEGMEIYCRPAKKPPRSSNSNFTSLEQLRAR